ncbi:MAG TPA: hypothetical protein VFS40_05850 [Gemmatimonadales bacterium]|nr:hypothetical protein [Gemmatimonadales bacterium]
MPRRAPPHLRAVARVLRLALLAGGLLPGTRHVARAQAAPATPADSARITGVVRSQDGGPLEGARVGFVPDTGHGREPATATGAGGRFALRVPARTEGRLEIAALGHSPATIALPPLAPGSEHQVAATLAPRHVLDAVTVTAPHARPLLNTEDAATGGTLERTELAALPTDARDPLTLAFTLPGVAPSTGFFGDAPPLSLAGGNALYTEYSLDGLANTEGYLGGPRVEVPLDALERLDVHVTTYGAALGRGANGLVDAWSRAGGARWQGDLFAYARPGRDALFGLDFDAAPKLVPAGVDPNGFKRYQLGGAAGGPLARGRTFLFGAAEYTNEDEARIGSTARATFTGLEERQKVKLLARLDHGWSPTQTTTLRAAFSSTDRAGRGTGFVVPEADITTRRIGSLAALTHRSALAGGRVSNTASAQLGTFRWFFPPAHGDLTRPQVTILAPDSTLEAVVGSTNFVFDETEHQLELRDVVEVDLGGGHALRLGVEGTRSWFRLSAASTNPHGAYTVFDDGNIVPQGPLLAFDDVPADVRVASYTIDASPQQVNLTQSLIGAFVEDRWRVTPSLTVTAGLRWDYDDITSRGASRPDLDNFQPRVSVNWYARPTMVVRGGAGLYAGKLPYAIWSDAVQFGANGNAVVTFEGDSAPRFLQGRTPAQLEARRDRLPAREIRLPFALGLEQPVSRQASVGWQFQPGADWAISLDGVWVETRHLPRSVDLNAITVQRGPADSLPVPIAAGDAERPVAPVPGSYRRLTTTQSGGTARYRALFTTVRRRLSSGWAVDASWVWAHAENDTEDINFNATQANCFGRDFRDALTGAPCTTSEWADAINDRRHKVSVRSVWTVGGRLRLSAIADWQTGQPVNRIAGRLAPDGGFVTYDLDGSGPIYGEGFVGNLDRFYGVPRNGERLPNFFELSGGVAWLLSFGGSALELRADVFNALNATEWGNYANGVPGGGSRTQVGHPGAPIVLRSPGRPRQLQLSARYGFR